ncbi:very short patch repair endonuclease [Spirillospora sp. NPDC049024]
MTSGWWGERPPDTAWRPSPGLSMAARGREQDAAAGGHENRIIRLADDRSAIASIRLRLPPKSRRLYAYLRWSIGGQTFERYVGEVRGTNRAENLAEAWRIARDREFTIPKSSSKPSGDTDKPWASTPAVRAVMRANKGKDTKPELRLRSAVHALGLRYRVSARPLPSIRRTADLVFAGPKVAVFLDGCFWHGCPEHHRPARRNSEFWKSKIERNRERDRETDQKLTEAGWAVLRIWEHEDLKSAAQRVADLVQARKAAQSRAKTTRGG